MEMAFPKILLNCTNSSFMLPSVKVLVLLTYTTYQSPLTEHSNSFQGYHLSLSSIKSSLLHRMRLKNIVNTPNGYILLQEVANYSLTKIYYFAHLSIQELLAAHYVAYHLSSANELKVIHEFFGVTNT